MNDFQKRAVSHAGRFEFFKSWFQAHTFITIAFVVLGVLTLKGVAGAIQVGRPFSITQIITSAVGQDFPTDSTGHVNILLLGIGGEGHSGEHLTDTMMVVSVNPREKTIAMLSLPRDLYVENETLGYGSRLNSVYELLLEDDQSHEVAIGALRSEVEHVTGVEIQRYAMIDFRGLEAIVDAVGGIDVNVKESIYDTAYPAADESIRYEPLYREAGAQTLGGETALKCARSRHTSNDFDRALRQQEVIQAIKDKALSIGALTSPNSIKAIVSAVSENLTTDISLSEMITWAGKASSFEDSDIVNMVITNDATAPGGLLFQPEMDLYAGAYVLIPYVKDFSELQSFSERFLHHPEIFNEPSPITVFNGTKKEGLAGLVKMTLTRNGFNVVDSANLDEKGLTQTRLYIVGEPDEKILETLSLISNIIPGKIDDAVEGEPETAPYIRIELGEDFSEYSSANKEKFYWGIF